MKKILLSLFGIITLGLINFGNCFNLDDNVISWIDENSINSGSFSNVGPYVNLFDFGNEDDSILRNYCVIFKNFTRSSDFGYRITFVSSLSTTTNGNYFGTSSPYTIYCVNGRRRYLALTTSTSSNKFSAEKFRVIDPEILFFTISSMSEIQDNLSICQSNLSSCQSDLNTCQNSSCQSELAQCQNDYSTCSNSLGNCGAGLNSCQSALGNCMQGNIGTGQNWSALFINGIQHVGRSIIDIYIPDEISWDYSFDDTQFNLYVSGYNVDTEYIDNIIRTQNYKPTSEDFTELVKMLAPYSKIIIFCVFLFIVWAWIKKPFKSKKL